MPFHPWQSNFSSGEITPLMLARVDVEKYKNAAACLENYVPLAQGGAARRAGTNFVAFAKDSTHNVRLAPFTFNQNQAYTIEFGHLYLRLFTNRALLRA